MNDSPKINIFALPNQTTILFGVLVIIILGAVIAGSMNVAPVSMRPIAVLLVLLPLRAFLARPEREFAHYRELVESKEGFEKLQAELTFLAQIELQLPRKPILKIVERGPFIQTIGTFRHWYILINLDKATDLQEKLTEEESREKIRARLIHELYHFKTGDYWQLGYARELLRLTFLIMLWALAFSLGYGILLLLAKPDVLQFDMAAAFEQIRASAPPPIHDIVEELLPALQTQLLPLVEEARRKAATLSIPLVISFAFGSTYPFVLMGLLLWGVYWRKLWRIREFYADAGSAHTQGHSKPIIDTLRASAEKDDGPKGWQRFFLRFQKFHAFADERLAALTNPNRVYENWIGTAILSGSLAFILEILLVTPLTLMYVGRFPMHLPTLAVFVIVCFIFLIPTIARGQAVMNDLFKIIGAITAFRLILVGGALIFLAGMLVLAPNALAESMTVAVYVIIRFAGIPQKPVSDNWTNFVATAAVRNLLQVVVIGAIWFGALTLTTLLLRRVLTWYNAPLAEKYIMKASRRLIWGMCAFLGLTVIPLATAVSLTPENMLHPLNLLIMASGILVAVIGLGWFWQADQKYNRYCPNCNHQVIGHHVPGKQCQQCGTLLYPWLLATYEDV